MDITSYAWLLVNLHVSQDLTWFKFICMILHTIIMDKYGTTHCNYNMHEFY